MPFIARRRLTDSIDNCIKPDDLSELEKKNIFYCPGCSCHYLYRSESSNQKAAHFYRHGNHDPRCWMPVAESIKGAVDDYETDDFALETFYDAIVSASKRVGKGPGTAGGGSPRKTKKHLSTIRNLYKFCCYHDNNHFVSDDLQVRDIIVSRKTLYLYTTFVMGIKLIEAHYWRYNPDTKTIFFYYPFSAETAKEAVLKIVTHCHPDTFSMLCNKMFGTNRIILLLSDWNTVGDYIHGNIDNMHQLVVL